MLVDPAAFHAVVSGQRRGIGPALARGGLRIAEVPYAAAMRLRNWRYDSGRSRIHRVDVPVISVGNLTLGGTGKTPMVAWLARWLRDHNVRVTLISRGYGSTGGGRNDEALELELQLPDVPHLQNADRIAAAAVAIEEFECQMILLDDGFQHRRLARDLDIVLLDACEPFGYGHVFPRGLLREPVCGLSRAQVVALSRADMKSAEERETIRRTVARYAPQAAWLEMTHQPRCLRSAAGLETAFDSLTNQPVAAFCGIGNPQGFRHTLESIGCRITAFREFPDHHAYARDDIADLTGWAADAHAAAVICTQKDLVKIGLEQLGRQPLFALQIGLGFLNGKEALLERLRPLLPKPPGV